MNEIIEFLEALVKELIISLLPLLKLRVLGHLNLEQIRINWG